jgi:tetratricopeptide (TPR) repeat protein
MTALKDVVLFKINAEIGDGVALAKRFQVEGYPTFVLASAGAETLERWRGYGEVEEFIGTLGSALADPTTIEQKSARFQKNPTASDAAKLATYHEARDEYVEAVAYFRKAAKMNKDASVDYKEHIFNAVASGALKEQIDIAEVKPAADALLEWDGVTVENAIWVGRTMTRLGQERDDIAMAAPYLEHALKMSEGVEDEKLQTQRDRLLLSKALYIDKDTSGALELKRAAMKDGWLEDSASLNDFAWWCFENKVNLDEAYELARKGAELEDDPASKAMILDTVAELCNARGDCRDAVYYIELALKESPESEYYAKQLDRFQELLAQQ